MPKKGAARAAPIAEAKTLKSQAQSLMRDLDAILANKDLGEDLVGQFKSLRTALKKKWSDLGDSAAEESADDLLARAGRLLREAPAILMQDDSYLGTQSMVQAALDMLYPQEPGDYDYYWDFGNDRPCIIDLYDTVVVFKYEGQLWRCDYAIDDSSGEDVVTLGEPSPVEAAYVPDVPTRAALGEALLRDGKRAGCFLPTDLLARLTEAPAPPDPPTVVEASHEVAIEGDLVPLVEKAVAPDGGLKIKIIQPGWGSSGYYPAEVLKRDGPDVFPAGMKMYWNHQTAAEEAARPEGDLSSVAAVLTSPATYDEHGASGPGLYAGAKAFSSYREAIDELAPHIGTSIRAMGKAVSGEAEGRAGKIIERLTSGKSVDFVTEPGAGGEVLQLFEAARGRPTPSGGTHVADEISAQEAKTLREAMSGLERQLAESQAMIARQNEAILLRDARDLITQVLAESEMPDLTRKRLLDDLVKRPAIKDGQLDRDATTLAVREAVKAELTYLAQATGGTGQIKGMGSNGGVSPAWQEQSEKKLARGLARLGLSESAAATAARGR